MRAVKSAKRYDFAWMREQVLACTLLAILVATVTKADSDFPHPSKAWGAQKFLEQTDQPTSISKEGDDYAIFNNVWFHNERYYAFSEKQSPNAQMPTSMSQNTALTTLPVGTLRDFFRNIKAHWLGGLSILIDFPTPSYTESMGHWTEVMVPIFCALASQGWQKATGNAPLRNLIFTNVQRQNLTARDAARRYGGSLLQPPYTSSSTIGFDWVWGMWEVTLSPLNLRRRPNILFWDDLDAVSHDNWLCMQHLLVANDRYSHPEGRAGFWSNQLGQSFREAAVWLQGLKLPEQPPRTITFLSGVAAEEVVNQLELVEYLKDTAANFDMQVRPYTATVEAPFASFLSVMSRTGILVARHGPLLANAIFLPPGALVVELLPYNWEWLGSSRAFKNMTQSIGDVHHVAWRAVHPRHALFATADDARFAEWEAEECRSAECLDIHASAAMLADCSAVLELLHRMLPAVFQNISPSMADLPWPDVRPKISASRFAWERPPQLTST